MGEITEAAPSRPTITIPPRAPFETLFAVGSIPGFSPGPMTLMSSFFSDSDSCSFSQLLAGAMASPLAKPSLLADNSMKDGDSGPGNEKLSGYKQKQPMSLLVAQSPLFMVSPRFSPSVLNSPGFLSPLQSPFGMSHQQALAHVTAQAAINQSYKQMQAEYQHSSSTEAVGRQSSSMKNQVLQGEAANVPLDQESLKVETSEVSQADSKVTSGAVEKPASDGYNWRKYGQKLVKGSECPRSYYRCTYLNCAVRKKVERSPDGHIIEITYKGKHNHELPKSNKRKLDDCDQECRGDNSQAKLQSASHGWTEMNNKVACSQPEKVSTKLLSEQLTVASKRDEMEETVTALDEKDGDEPNAEKRSLEAGSSVLPSSHKTVMEPKIIVQTRSEVDLLDDGYKWRKYGQKVVKGNANPRSYYRCTYKGCNVRKHVERASADPKAVITTYEGKHNHDIPIAPKQQS